MLNRIHIAYLGGYSELCQISKNELFTQIVNRLKPLTIFVKSSMSNVSLGSCFFMFCFKNFYRVAFRNFTEKYIP